jgi:hypothetical protein
MTYPFVVSRRKVVKVTADSYDNALNKVLMKNPVKIITTTFAQNLAGRKHLPTTPEELKIEHLKYKPIKLILNTMDLISAKVEAANVSKKERKRIYIYIDGEGECLLTSIQPKNKDLVQAVFVNGAEIKLEDIEQQTISTMSTKVKKAPVKKTAKKVTAAKKSPAKKILKPAKSTEEKIPRGNNMFLTQAEWNKVDKVRGEESFSAWCRGLVQAKIK